MIEILDSPSPPGSPVAKRARVTEAGAGARGGERLAFVNGCQEPAVSPSDGARKAVLAYLADLQAVAACLKEEEGGQASFPCAFDAVRARDVELQKNTAPATPPRSPPSSPPRSTGTWTSSHRSITRTRAAAAATTTCR